MSYHAKLRESKRCENCGHFVEKQFCPECGQENVETRQPFYHLFTHFIADFLHYDGRFWKSILHLLFRPAKLTKEYLAGKRKLYVAPVTLYIFISFITFFIPAILPDLNTKEILKIEVNNDENNNNGNLTNSDIPDGEKDKDAQEKTSRQGSEKNINIKGKEIDTQNFDIDKWKERIIHDFSKAIFLYMPFFAFWLWLFHSKKKWYYFDHGIFTLHFFSFILLSSLLFIVINWLSSFLNFNISFVKAMIILTAFCYSIYYFFHSHRLVYQESKAISRLKCSFLFIINSFCVLLFLLLYILVETYISNAVLFNEFMNALKKT